ncbi:MAG: XrtB/PEP-CTERM-associated polysaccharide biosynthesis outer membrane protein EpsL [Burkholderiales bacterium]
MSRVIRPGRPLLGIALALGCSAAFALQGDRIRPSAALNYTYFDNVYYLDDRLNASQLAIIKNGQKSDQVLGVRLGLDVDHYYQRQTFALRSQITDNRHMTYDQLNYVAYNARGVWTWVAGTRYDGDLGLEKTQVASTLYDFRTTDRTVRNLRDQTSFFGSGMVKMTADWKLRGALRYNNIDNSLSRFNSQDRQEWVAEAGSRYYSKGSDDYLGLNFRYVDGRFPNREVVNTSTVDNGFHQYTLEGQVDYQYTGLTRISGSLGYTTRQQRQLSQRNFSGITGRLTGTYALSSKTSLTGAVFREIGSWEDITANYIVTTGLSLGVSQGLTEKLSAQLSASARHRSFQGDPLAVASVLPKRADRLNSYSASLIWTPTRLTRFDLSLSYDTRDANDAWALVGFGSFNNFNVITLFGQAQITF